MPTAPSVVPQSVGRALDLLGIVVEAGECNLTTAAGEAGLTPTTALRHLRALEARGYLHRDERGVFAAGPTFLRLASAAFDHGPVARLIASARPRLAELTEQTGESSYLAVADGTQAVYLATCESSRAIRHVGWVGKAVPQDGTAVGEVLRGSQDTVVRSGAVEPDITAVAHPVGDDRGIVAALSVIGPAHRMDDALIDVAADALRSAARAMAVDLGLQAEAVAS